MGQVADKMQDNQRSMMLAQREMMMATQVAMMRDNFEWLKMTYATMAPLFLLGAAKNKNPAMLIPLVPMSYGLWFNYDAAYGDKFERITTGAEKVLAEERSRLVVPQGNRMMSRDEYIARLVNPPPPVGYKKEAGPPLALFGSGARDKQHVSPAPPKRLAALSIHSIDGVLNHGAPPRMSSSMSAEPLPLRTRTSCARSF
eukprot:CAMPEP_0174850768 /NCGR_PEP_ID=MMETSP1114-20130205/21131_1 /TAXON_ID=312471 /ORGANISM="Neobodo designis, Strain CCAP 1951/1" /LENGTH=199 /DNA_ID=CAMNT_0016085255 /DNA_START=65 /DNA_END=662 /DNA_ORIENTATION=+